jgi:hypothetical protein
MPTLDRPRIEYRTPPDLVAEVKAGAIRVPPFQRGFKWESADVIALFDSVWHGYPIGNLLLWRRPAPAGRVVVGPVVIDAPELDVAYWVVDGQQRITSLVGALTAAEGVVDHRFRIYLDLESASFHAVGLRQQPPPHWVPVNRLIDTSTLLAWARENASWIGDRHINVADAAAKAIREYQIPTYVVTSGDELPLRIIFDRLNNTGKPLSKAEVFHALHSGLAGQEPADLRGIGAVPAVLGFGRIDDRLALRCVLAYRGGDIFREDFHDEFSSDDDRRSTFRGVGAALRAVVEFIQHEAGIPHGKLLPYSHIVPVLTRFVRLHGEPRDWVAHLLRRWVWRDAVAGTAARGTSVVAVRQAVEAVDTDNPLDAAQTLLQQVPASQAGGFVPDLGKTHLNHAAAKINLLGILAARPCDLVSGQPLDLSVAFDTGNPVRDIIGDRAISLARTFANRAVVGSVPNRSVRMALAEAPGEVAESHLIDSVGQRQLATGDVEGFLRRRSEAVADTVRAHVSAMAEWGARDGQRIAEMMRSAV